MTDLTDKPTLLFVDDESRVGRLLRMMFRGDYHVHTATGAREALAILEALPVHVIISDQRMPEMTGVQLLSQVRSRWPETVRLLLTGYSDLVAIIASINEGEVHRFLNKPWEQLDLREAIAEAAELAESLRATRGRVGSVWSGERDGSQFSISSTVLVIEERPEELREIENYLGDDYAVKTASSFEDSIQYLVSDDIGVVVSSIDVASFNAGQLLGEIAQIDPSITSVAMTSQPHGEAIIRLINEGRIFRFAIKPLSLNLFRSAVGSAMREHHRRLADPRIIRRRMHSDMSADQIRQRLLDQIRPETRPESGI